jgi:hypothetical protein
MQSQLRKETAMFKLLIGLPLVAAFSLLCVFGAALLLPLAGLGIGAIAIVLAVGILVLVLRLLVAIAVGLSGVLFGALLLGGVIAGGAVVLALGAALAHLLVPVLVVCGLVWLIRHLSRPLPPVIGRV